MDRYQKVVKSKPESPVNENELRITSQGLVRNYISYATSLLQERRVREIVLKAMGQAISKTVAIAEIIKKRVPRLHQDTAISSVSIIDTFEPIEEGLQIVEQTRHVSMISITLSTNELNMNHPGYQAPSNIDQNRQQYKYPPQRQLPRQAPGGYNSGNGDTYGRGRRSGRGRGRGWNRGGYSNYQENGGYQDGYSGGNGGYSGGFLAGNGGYQGGYSGGYSNWGRGGGRGGWVHRGGDGYGRGRGGGGRGFVRGRGWVGGHGEPRGGGRQA